MAIMQMINERNVSLLRKYIYEIALIVMGACIAFLFMANSKLSADMRTILIDVVNRNSAVIQDNSNALREMRIELRENGRTR